MGDENPNKTITISDYVVCTILSWHAQYDKEVIKTTALECFGETELKSAMNDFCFNEDITGALTPASRHRDKDKCFDAIYRQIVSLDSAGHMPNIVVSYKDLYKVPRRFPGEKSSDPILDRIAFLERSVGRIVSQNENIMSEVVDMKKPAVAINVPSFSNIVSQQSASVQPAMLMGNNVQPVTQARSHSNAVQVIQERNHTSAHHIPQARNHISVQSNAGQIPRRAQVHGDINQAADNAHSANDNEGWQEQNRRRRPRPKAIQGTYKSQGENVARRTWAAAPRDMFVYHTDIQTSEDDIRAIVEETSNVDILEIEKKSHVNAYYGSFRVSVRRNDYAKAMLPENWPDGWSIREYFRPRAKQVSVASVSLENNSVDSNNTSSSVDSASTSSVDSASTSST
jgi:hypothetical protein